MAVTNSNRYISEGTMGGYFAQTRFSVKKKCELKALVVNVATVLYLIRSVDPGLRQVYKKCLLKKNSRTVLEKKKLVKCTTMK